MQKQPALLTIKNSSNLLGISTKTLRRWEKSGKIQAIRTVGGHRRFRLEDLNNLKGKKPQRQTQSLIAINNAAEDLGVSEKTIRRWEKEGKMESVRTAGGHRRFTTEAIQQVKNKKYQPVQVKKEVPIPPKEVIKIIDQRQLFTPQAPSLASLNPFLSPFNFKLISFVAVSSLLIFIATSPLKVGRLINKLTGISVPGIPEEELISPPGDWLSVLSAQGGIYEGDVGITGRVGITGSLDVSETITTEDLVVEGSASIYSLSVTSGLVVGDNKIINSSGKIPALNGSYFESLNGENIINVDAHHLNGVAASSFLRSDEVDTAEATINFTATPGSSDVNGGPVYINPAASTSNYTLFGISVDGSQRFKIDTEGDVSISGNTTVDGTIYGNGSGISGVTASDLTCVDCLDFTELADSLTLDASTNISLGALTLSTSGTGAIDFNSTGQVSFAGNIDANGSTNDISGTLNLSGGALTSTGALTITPHAGNNLNIALSTTGDFAVNTNQLYVDTSEGNVGIGTAGPSTAVSVPSPLLHISGTKPVLRFEDTDATDSYSFFQSADSFYLYNEDDGNFPMTVLGTGVTYFNSGNVGIGTAEPDSPLQVSASAPAQGILGHLYNSSGTGGAYQQFTQAGVVDWAIGTKGSNTNFVINTGKNPATAGTDLMTITTTGNVGIGTTTTSDTLVVRNGTSNTKVKILGMNNAAGTQAQLTLATINSESNYEKAAIIANNVAGSWGRSNLHFALDNAADTGNVDISDSKMVITSAGNVGIGTTSPEAKFHIQGMPDANGTYNSSTDGVAWRSTLIGARIFADETNERFVIQANKNGVTDNVDLLLNPNNGNVGIGRSPAANKLEVEGNASKTAAGDWLANSDIRIKTDVLGLDNALDIIDSLRPVKFKYIDEYMDEHPSLEDRYYYNFIAQEFQEVFPDSVQDSGENGILQMDSYNVRPYLVAAMQELNTKVETLELGLDSGLVLGLETESGETKDEAESTEVINELVSRVDSLETGMLLLNSSLDLASPTNATDSSFLTSLTVLGDSVLGDTVINGRLDIGILSFDNLTGSIDAIGPLKLQPLALAPIEFVGGNIEMDQDGNLDIKEGQIHGNDTFRGKATLSAGETEVVIEKNWAEAPYAVVVTPSYTVALSTDDISKNGFTIKVEKPSSENEELHWFAIW